MTLILGMSKPEGIYLSVDYRVSNRDTKEIIDDATEKFFRVNYPPIQNPPLPNGPRALAAYAGAAFARDGTTPMGDWLMDVVSSAVEYFDESMQRLGNRLNDDLSAYFHRHKIPLIVVRAALQHAGPRVVGGYSNMEPDGTVLREFEYHMMELPEKEVFSIGSGGTPRELSDHLDLLRAQLDVTPRSQQDHMKLLATVNRRIAERVPSVSPHCHVSFVNADERFAPMSRTFAEPGTSLPFTTRVIMGGFDLRFFDQLLREHLGNEAADDDPDDSADT